MRGALLILIVLGSIPVIFVKPYVGLLVYTWISYFNPHRMVFGFAESIPYALLVSGITILAWFISREPKRIQWSGLTLLLIMFGVWTSVTTVVALGDPDEVFYKWETFMKVLLMTFITIPLISNRWRLDLLIWVIVLSIGFYGVRGGIFWVATGGQYIVWGPEGSFLGSNNSIGVALCMMIPMMRYLQLQATKRWIRLGLTGAMLTSGVSIVGTYSRGALLAVVAMGFVFWMKSRRRLVLGIVGAIAVFAAVAVTPTKWFDRMNTIETYEEDKSAMDRIEIWTHMYRIALDRPIVGGGFEIATDTSFYAKYRTDLTWGRSPHSAYFEVLGEHGFVGLAIYLGLGIGMWLSAGRLIRRTRKSPEHRWAADLGGMIQVALVGYAVGAAFINKAYYEPFFHLAAILIVVHAIVARDRHEATGQEYWRGPAGQAGTMERPGRTRSLPQA